MTREEKIQRARALGAEGWSQNRIGHELGVTGSCVWKWLNPERAREKVRRDNARRHAAKLAWQYERDHSLAGRGECPACGGPLGVAAARKPARRECRSCLLRRAEERRLRIRTLWHEGRTLAEIAEALGSTPNAVGADVARMRDAGYDLPYRHPNTRPKHPDLAAAA